MKKWKQFLKEAYGTTKVSAGVLLYKYDEDAQAQKVYLVHAGGPFNKNNPNAWGIPKGSVEEGEGLQQAAKREFEEEMGTELPGKLTFELGPIKTGGGKTVYAFACEGNLPLGFKPSSNTVQMSYQGRMMEFPEVDDGGWFTFEEAEGIINRRQIPFLTDLQSHLQDKQPISEAVDKKPKAIFMAGGPGSGKTTLLKQIGALDAGMQVINADDEFEPMLKAAGLPLDLDHPEREIRSQQGKLFVQAQNLAKQKTRALVGDRNDFIIDGTAGSLQNVRKAKERLEDAGYDTAMIYVDVPLELSLSRNEERGKAGGRKVKPERVEKSWQAVNKNKEAYKNLFDNNFIYFDGTSENIDNQVNDVASSYDRFISS